MITRVRNLTRMNVNALFETCLASKLGATYAEFDGYTPDRALDAVRNTMVHYAQTVGINSTYNSLRAVERKLAKAAPRFNPNGTELALTNHVSVVR